MATGTKNNLRQRTWGVFVKPYVIYQDKPYVKNDPLKTTGVCNGGETTALGGEPWMLNEVTTSFPRVREIVRELMETGMLHEDIMVTEIIPTDYVITPLA